MKCISEIGKIKAPLFIVGLFTLLVNDFYLKYAFPNELTGKLSDFAGLFIFPFFFSALWPQFRKSIHITTAAAFTIWKSPLSQPLIDIGNSIGVKIFRTVDYSDLLALIIIPLSYKYFRNGTFHYGNHNKPFIVSLAVVTIFSFCATTLKRQEVEILLDTDKLFILNLSKEEVFNRLSPANSNTETIEGNNNDSLFYLYFDIPDLKANVTAAAEIYRLDPKRTVIKLDSVKTVYITGGLFSGVDQDDLDKVKKLKPAQLEEYFEKYFVKELENNSTENYLHYEIKVIQEGNDDTN